MIARIGQAWDRATPQVKRPFYIGITVGFVLAVLVGLGIGNTDSYLVLPSSLEGVATSQAIWGLKPSNLLMVLPLGAFLVVLARSFVGLKAFGLFTPMLIAVAFLQIGPVMGPVVLCSSVLVGMIVTPSLLKLRMTRVGFLGVLISLIVLVLVAMQLIFDVKLQVDAFPVIVCALCVERWWKQWGKDGAKPAAKMAFNTFALAVVIEFVMVSDFALALIEWSPLLMPAFTAVAIGVLGRYRGLRLSEIHRFAPIWLERRRQARDKANSDQLELDLEPVTWEERRESAPPLTGVWVINSPEDLKPNRRRRVPQPIMPNKEAQFEPRLGANGRPMIHNAWIITSAEDV
jgi:7 transmembrane helices usually fused to an inactive transglutaminase